MTGHSGRNKRLLLYFDILGFREMVNAGEAEKVRTVLSLALNHADEQADKRSAKLGSRVETIYFSDTILIHLDETGFSDKAFRQLRFAATALTRALLAENVPISGVLTYGDFVVSRVGDSRKPVYFGKALIDAYDRDKQEKWLGVLVGPTVTAELSDEAIQSGIDEGNWMVRGKSKDCKCLLLNPFSALKNALESHGEGATLRSLEAFELLALKSLRFVCRTSEGFARKADFSSSVAVRYHATAAFAKSVLGDKCYQWAVSLPDRAPESRSFRRGKGDSRQRSSGHT